MLLYTYTYYEEEEVDEYEDENLCYLFGIVANICTRLEDPLSLYAGYLSKYLLNKEHS